MFLIVNNTTFKATNYFLTDCTEYFCLVNVEISDQMQFINKLGVLLLESCNSHEHLYSHRIQAG